MAKIREATEKTQQRQEIINVSRALFEKHGIKPITMDMIAKSMKISKRTLYEIFRDKESLLIETLNYIRKIEHEAIDEFSLTNDNVLEVILYTLHRRVEQMRNVNPRFLTDLIGYPTVLEAMREENEQSMEDANRFFLRGVKQGLFRKDINFKIFLELMQLQMREVVFHSQMSCEASPADIHNSVILVSLRGISTEEGLKVIDGYVEAKNDDNKLG
jgi:AcrR family transcriptional regulator